MDRNKDGTAGNGYRRDSSTEQVVILPIMTRLVVDRTGHPNDTPTGLDHRGLEYPRQRSSLGSIQAIQPTTSLALLPPIDGIVKSRSASSLPEGGSDAADSCLSINFIPGTTAISSSNNNDVRCSVYNEVRLESSARLKLAVGISESNLNEGSAPSGSRSSQVKRKHPPHSLNHLSEQSLSSASNCTPQRRFNGYLIPLNVPDSASGVLEGQKDRGYYGTLKYPSPLAGIQSANYESAENEKTCRHSVGSEQTVQHTLR